MDNNNEDLLQSDAAELARRLGDALRLGGLKIATAESCTGGGMASLITSVSGSSDYFRGAVVAYQADVKEALLGVSAETIDNHGVVSRQTATEMARGAMRLLGADCAIASTGIAGPGGAEPGKPVGTIWLCFSVGDRDCTLLLHDDHGSRVKNTSNAVLCALRLALQNLDQ